MATNIGRRVTKLKGNITKLYKKFESFHDEIDSMVADLSESSDEDYSTITCCFEACLAELSQLESELDVVIDEVGPGDHDDDEDTEEL